MLNLDFSNEANREKAYKYLSDVMEESYQLLCSEKEDERREKTQHLFNTSTHVYLTNNAWEILLPLKHEKRGPKFQEMKYDSLMKRPQAATYCYTMDVIAPPSIPSGILHFGYAFLDDKPIRSAFFVVQGMVEYQIMPQGLVIDPLANQHGIKPSFYVGCSVDKEDIQNFLFSRINPLEAFVQKINKKANDDRLAQSYMEGYFYQMRFEPGLFSEQLMEFAVNNNLHIPYSENNNRLKKIYELKKKDA